MIDTQTDTLKYIVYKHTSPSGKVYIGITKNSPDYRWKHGDGYKTQKIFARAIKKYGWNNFLHEILFENLSHDEACKKEIELINFYKLQKLSYNQTDGGDGCLGFHNKGYHHSEKIKKQISESKKGKHFSKEHIKHIRESGTCFQKGQTPWNKGLTTSKETREKIGNNNPNAKKVIDIETGKIYFSLKDLIRKEHLLDGYHKLRHQIKMNKCIRYKYIDQ